MDHNAGEKPQQLSGAEWAALAAILLIAAAVRIYALGRQPLWWDEQGQLLVAQSKTFSEFWQKAGDNGPIGRLSYLDSWLAWQMGADTRALFRLPSALWGVAGVALAFAAGRRAFGSSAGLFAAALLAVCGEHIHYSREARGYALLVAVSLLCWMLLDEFARKPSLLRGAFLFAAAAAALLIHPVFFVVLGALAVTALALLGFDSSEQVPRVRTLLALVAIVAAAGAIFYCVPRPLPVLIVNPQDERPTLAFLLYDIYKALLGGYWGAPSFAIFAFACWGIVAGLSSAAMRRGTLYALAVSLAASAPIVAGHLQGMYVVSRYSLFAAPFLLMLAACGIHAAAERFKLSKTGQACAAAVLALGLLGGMPLQGRSPYDLERGKLSNPERPSLSK